MNTRRSFLRNTSVGTGSLVLSPILAQLHAQSIGAKRPPRFVFVVEGNGLPPDQITPIGYKRPRIAHMKFLITNGVGHPGYSGVTKMVNESLTDKELPEALAPIKKYQHQLTV